MKPYWAITDIEYGHLFADVELFIIFGCSLGATDGWWRRILAALGGEPADDKPASELVIYWWSGPDAPDSSEDIIEKFTVGAGVEPRDPLPPTGS